MKHIPVQVDNSAAQNPELQLKAKHTAIKPFFSRKKIVGSTADSTERQIADRITKPLPRARLQTLKSNRARKIFY